MDNISCTSLESGFRPSSWAEATRLVLEMDLEGLSIRCPKCGRPGIPFPKWVRGPKVKPLYILHRSADGCKEACLLDSEEAKQLRGKASLELNDVKKLVRNANVFILFSGGSDSLCTLDYTNRIAMKTEKRITAIYVDTTVGFPEIKDYVKKVCRQLRVDLKILEPRTDFFTLARKWGIPNHSSRWCCRVLKIQPIAHFLAKQRRPIIVFDGIRAAESSIRAKYMPLWFHPSFKCLSVSPIFHWSDREVRFYIAKRNLPKSPSFSLRSSSECWCGAYKKKKDFEELYGLHPEIYKGLEDIERHNKNGFKFIYENGNKMSLEDLRKQIEGTNF